MEKSNGDKRIPISELKERSIITVDQNLYTREGFQVQEALADIFLPLGLAMRKLLVQGKKLTPFQAVEIAENMSKILRSKADKLDNISHSINPGIVRSNTGEEK